MRSLPPIDVRLKSFAFGGEVVGTLPDGRSVFVPYGLPGELVRIEILEEKRRYARGRLMEILEPAADRIQPPCRHFGTCGGCDYQHIPYARQLEIKKALLGEQLQRIAGIADANIRDCVPSQAVWNYRNYLQFHLDNLGHLGFRMARSEKVIRIEECFLPEAGIRDAWPGLIFEADLPVDRIGIREGQMGDVQVILEGATPETPDVSVEDVPVSVVHLVRNDCVVLAGSKWVIFGLGERQFRVSAGAFFQVNSQVASEMVRYVLEKVEATEDTTLLELYSGVGLFSAFLAGKVKKLIAVESSEAACDDFVFNLDDFDNVELYEGRVEDLLDSISVDPQVILLDPPRSGVGSKVIDQIGKLGAIQVIYISCDPTTLARDARNLIHSGYKLEESTPFDMFPQTGHIESISIFRC